MTRPRIGIFADCTDLSMPILELAEALEERGFEGLFLNEHTHLPVDTPRSQYPAGGPTPERYARFWDPYIALSFVAARTALEVGPCVSLVAEHDPIALAKAVATLDVLSGGRFVLGVGFGWNREEVEDHGHDAKVRARVVEEAVAVMRALWTKEIASLRRGLLPPEPQQIVAQASAAAASSGAAGRPGERAQFPAYRELGRRLDPHGLQADGAGFRRMAGAGGAGV